jgi:hypothetical protein
MERSHAMMEEISVFVYAGTGAADLCGGKMRTLLFYEAPALLGQSLAHKLESTVAIGYNHTRPS